jgi:NADH:flavin oxidoreductase / NADH oxidase family
MSPTQIGVKSLSVLTVFIMEPKHRVVMGPLPCPRSVQPRNIPGDWMLEYYRQGASEGGLIVCEATSISIQAEGGSEPRASIREPLARPTVSEMSKKDPLSDSMVARYGLRATPYSQIANWAFMDRVVDFRDETALRTIKIPQAGFACSIDTHQSLRRQLTRLRDLRIVP